MITPIRPEEKMLLPEEPDPVGIYNPVENASFLFLCEHAENRIPAALDMLGLPRSEINRHIGWDIGALETAKALAKRLNAPLFFQRYSRLVIDCNRPLESGGLIPQKSESTLIPGNKEVSESERIQRIDEIWNPYQQAVRNYLEKKKPPKPFVITMHSFTPVFRGEKRPWEVGLLYNRCPETAAVLKERLRVNAPGVNIGMNQPYSVSDEEDYTIPIFGETMGFYHVLVEIRQDLIDERAKREKWINLFLKAFRDLENYF
ncbi:N-formylglutamate amidohydrolase [Desulfospira joergensenii]|uniref:N-formylglutamate amidohydrolase n=1 Tax=Desulfospira joergensenii TaxID=53329 RepID=UPI0003B42A8C|nr:N-formylglutamate amidohydrolase [Desulfospira joergensenii]